MVHENMSVCFSKIFFQFKRFANHKTCAINVIRISKMPYYAVAKGRTPGIYMNWSDCESQVKGYSGARYKKFDTVLAAEEFIKLGGPVASKTAAIRNSYNGNSSYESSYSGGTTTSNLKRSYSTHSKQSKQSTNPKHDSRNYSRSDSEDSEIDMEREVTKQLDVIEKRVKNFGKGLDRIINKGSKGKQSILIEPPQPKKRKSDKTDNFEVDNDGYVQVYTDGACSANGRQGARAGLGVFWGDSHHLNISEPVSGRATNNCGEIQAATKAIRQALQNGITKLAINTDSKFLINSVTKWMPGWKRKGWKLQSGEPVKNEVDFKDLDSIQHKLEVKWNYVEAHKGIHGNEMADELARAGAAMYNK